VTTELTIYQRIADPVQAAQQLGTAIAKSRLLGCETVEQGVVMALECFARGCPPLALAQEYHIIDGNLSMRSEKMLANFLASGGKHVILSRTPNLAEVQLTIGDQTQTFSFSWEEAQAEGLDQGKKGVKTNWSTPRRRMQMLWARTISDGVRAMDPRCTSGRYAPEDFGVHQDDIPQPQQPQQTEDKPIDAEYTVESEPPAEQPAAEDLDAPGTVRKEQLETIRLLARKLELTADQQAAMLAKRGCQAGHNLSANQAKELTAKLNGLLAAKEAAAAAGEGSQATGDKSSADNIEPCTPAQVDEAKRLLTEFEQIKPGTIARMKAKLKASGLGKIADLSINDCERLTQALQFKKMDAFFQVDLEGAVPF